MGKDIRVEVPGAEIKAVGGYIGLQFTREFYATNPRWLVAAVALIILGAGAGFFVHPLVSFGLGLLCGAISLWIPQARTRTREIDTVLPKE
jgi:hypothetical protein